jgi:hypothetical protein
MPANIGPLDQIEGVFGITFTDNERMLLTTTDALLSPHERQARYVLAMALTACPCPVCQYLLCQRSASTQPFAPTASTPDDWYACPNCGTGLTWHLGITGQQWFAVTDPQGLANRLALADAEARTTGPVEITGQQADEILADPARTAALGLRPSPATVARRLGREDDRAKETGGGVDPVGGPE